MRKSSCMIPNIEKPKYFDSVQGHIIQAICINHQYTNKEISKFTRLPSETVYEEIGKLREEKDLYRHKGKWLVRKDLCEEWRAFFTNYSVYSIYDKQLFLKDEEADEELRLVNWVKSFLKHYDYRITGDNKHFFIENNSLISFTNMLIMQSDREIIVINPFMHVVEITKNLRRASEFGKRKVIVFTREIKGNQDCLDYLDEGGVFLLRFKDIHSKVLIVDNAVAVISSLNYTKSETSGGRFNSGIVTWDKEVVSEIRSSILSLEDKIISIK